MSHVIPEPPNGVSRRLLLGGAGGAALAASLAACTTKKSQEPQPSESAPGGGGTAGFMVWATHVYYNQPALVGVSVGFRDFLDSVGWKFQVTAAKQASDVQQTLQAQSQALALKPDVIVATMNDKTSFNSSLKAIQDAGIYLELNNTQPDEGNGLDAPYVGQSFSGAGAAAATTVLDAAVKAGKKDGTILLGYCCGNQGAVGTRTAGQLAGVKDYNAKNGTSFKTTELLDVSDSNPATAQGSWEAKLRAVTDLIGIVCDQVGDPSILAAKKLGKEAGFVPIVTFDVTEERLKLVEDGWFLGVVDQQPYAQGYIAAAQGWMYVKSKTKPPLIYDTGSTIITKDTVEDSRANSKYINTRAAELGIKV
jgi:ABC-type sugar transport system substrate-binding protein